MQITKARFALLGTVAASAAAVATAVVAAGPSMAAPATPTAVTAGAASTASRTASTVTRTDVSPKETLRTLRKLLPANLEQSRPKSLRGDQDVFNDAFVTVNDGKGLSLTEVQVGYVTFDASCADQAHPENCRVRADGSTIVTESVPNYRDEPGHRSVTIYHPDHSYIFLGSANGTAYKHTKPTRKTPPLTIAQLTKIADNPTWRFPR